MPSRTGPHSLSLLLIVFQHLLNIYHVSGTVLGVEKYKKSLLFDLHDTTRSKTLIMLPKLLTRSGQTSVGSVFFFNTVKILDLCAWGCELAHGRANPLPPAVPSSLPLFSSLAQWTSRDLEGKINVPTMFSIS